MNCAVYYSYFNNVQLQKGSDEEEKWVDDVTCVRGMARIDLKTCMKSFQADEADRLVSGDALCILIISLYLTGSSGPLSLITLPRQEAKPFLLKNSKA